MAIGGPMWQKSQAQQRVGLGYGQQMRQNFLAQRKASVSALGNKLFSTNINAGSAFVQLSFQMATSRVQADLKVASDRINQRILDAGLGDEVDLLA